MVGGGGDDMGGVITGDEVMLTSPPELAHCGGGTKGGGEGLKAPLRRRGRG